MAWPELVAFLREADGRAALAGVRRSATRARQRRRPVFDKPAGITSHDAVARVRRALGARGQGRPRRDARPVRHRAAAGPRRPRHPRAAVPDGAAQDATSAARASARCRAPAIPRARSSRPASCPTGDLVLPTGRVRQRPPGLLGGQGRRAGAPTRWPAPGWRSSSPSARSRWTASRRAGATGDRRGFVIECSSGTYVRSLIADLGDAYCETLRRTRIGDFDVADADPERIVEPVDGAGLPARAGARRRRRAAGRRTAWRWRWTRPAAGVVRLCRRWRADRPRREPRRGRRREAVVGWRPTPATASLPRRCA